MAQTYPPTPDSGQRGRRPARPGAAPNGWCTLRVYAEADGPVVALVLVTRERRGAEVWEMDLPYLLWQSMGTRAAAAWVARLFGLCYPTTLRRLGRRQVQCTIATELQLHSHERPRAQA